MGEALAEYPRGKRERAGRTEQLQSLREGDADFANRDVIQDVSEGDASDCRNNEDQIYVLGDLKRGADFSEGEGQWKQEG